MVDAAAAAAAAAAAEAAAAAAAAEAEAAEAAAVAATTIVRLADGGVGPHAGGNGGIKRGSSDRGGGPRALVGLGSSSGATQTAERGGGGLNGAVLGAFLDHGAPAALERRLAAARVREEVLDTAAGKSVAGQELKWAVAACPLLDHHCHNLVHDGSPVSLASCLSEATDGALKHAEHSLSYMRNMRVLSRLYCPVDEHAGSRPGARARRRASGSSASPPPPHRRPASGYVDLDHDWLERDRDGGDGPQLWSRPLPAGARPAALTSEEIEARRTWEERVDLSLRYSGIKAMLIDDGIRAAHRFQLSIQEHQRLLPEMFVARVLRVESLAEEVLEALAARGVGWTPASLRAGVMDHLRRLPANVVALKSIAAYRSGLQIDPAVRGTDVAAALCALESSFLASAAAARAAISPLGGSHASELDGGWRGARLYDSDNDLYAPRQQEWAEEPGRPPPVRIVDSAIIDFLFLLALECAVAQDIPLQVHVGFGDKDLDLQKANPLLLRRVLEDERFRGARLVLLHCYPFAREAGYLCSVYEQVYVDVGLSTPLLTSAGIIKTLSEILELSPSNKVLISTDGHFHPESFYLGVLYGKLAVLTVLRQTMEDGDLTLDEACRLARRLLWDNAAALYKLS